MAPDFDSIADELYGLLPGNFTSVRDARAAEARQTGDRELAAAIKGLKRPTSSAWLVNMLARSRSQQVDELLDLGSAMRAAHTQLAGDEIRRLSQQRRQVVADLARTARRLAADAGQAVSEEAARELEATLEVALAEPAAGETVRSGRLTTALKSSGLGSLDFAGEAAVPDKAGRTSNRTAVPRPSKRRESARNDQLATAELALQEAEAALNAAQGTVTELGGRVSAAREEYGRVREALTAAETELVRLHREESVAAGTLRETEKASEAAGRATRIVERRADVARRDLDQLRG